MSQSDLIAFMQSLQNAASSEELWVITRTYFRTFGVERMSYHHKPLGQKGQIFAEGFPDEWLCEYLDQKLHRVDPITRVAQTAHRPFLWSEVRNLTTISEEEGAYLRRLEAAELGDGLGLQVHGPMKRDGYVGLGFGAGSPVGLGADQVQQLQMAAQMAHMRYCELVPPTIGDGGAAGLTPRETDVLEWVARGKSNSVIADILGVSRHTIDTMLRRVFAKLEVNDRTTAVLVGLGAGVIQIR